jgi:O-antigen ligase
MIRHSFTGFSFKDINFVLNPFYRNHVTYASIMVVFFPFLWYATFWLRRYSMKWWGHIACIAFFLIAIYLSYTRAAYVSLVLAAGAYFIIRFRLMKVVLALAVVATIVGVNYVSTNNQYLEFAPDFDKAIMHEKFDNLLEATAKGEDISTMERVYRWVAGVQMVASEPWMGFGPGNFYTSYEQYTVNSFRTYVSDNPEQSGIHCYYLMTAVEQGIPGLIIFLLLCFGVLIKGEQLYHKNPSKRPVVLMVVLSLIIIDALLLINDMVETDKVGAFFFIGMAILVNIDIETTQESSRIKNQESSSKT